MSSFAVSICVWRDGWTKRLQLSLGTGDVPGYRLAGPKFNGSSKLLLSCPIDEHGAAEIRSALDRHFPARGGGR